MVMKIMKKQRNVFSFVQFLFYNYTSPPWISLFVLLRYVMFYVTN